MVKSRIKLAVKFIAFVLATVLCVCAVNNVLMPGEFYNDEWPTTNTYSDFYKLEKNSVDVLMLGSSHMMSALNPVVIYDNYGITSYNLGSEQQSLVVSYYWLREALKYQTPKVVILDTYMVHKYTDGYVYNDMNCSESCVRKAMDYMRLSPLKWEASKAIESIDPSQSALSFIFPNIRYHGRWTDLGKTDFTKNSLIAHGASKGFTVISGVEKELSYVPFTDESSNSSDMEVMVETQAQYLDKIVNLCNDKNIELILINIPCSESVRRYKSTKEYAIEKNIPYYDFNEEKLYKAIDYDAASNLLSHPNYLGAEKISNYVGNMLLKEYGVTAREDSSFDKAREFYNLRIDNALLLETTDIHDYLEKINSDRYTLFVFGPVSFSACIDDKIMEGFSNLGFNAELNNVNSGTHYFAVKEGDKITEKITEEDFSLSGSVGDGLVTYSTAVDTKNMMEVCHVYSMKVDGVEYGNSNNGLTFVIYDKEMKKVVDTVTFDTTTDALTAIR